MLLKTKSGSLRPAQPRALHQAGRVFVILSVFALGFTGFNEAEAPAPGVVAELRMNEGSGTTTADASGNAYNGTLTNGPTWVAGKYGQGINFDGSNDYVSFADNANFTLTPSVSYTWSAWIKNNNFNQWGTVWSQTLNTSNFFYFYAHTSTDAEAGPVTNGISVYWYSGANKLVLHSNNNVLTTGTWSYVTVTYNASVAQASRFTIYVNGVDVTNRTDVVSTGTIAAIDPSNTRIGANQPYGEYINAGIDEVRYYRRLLSLAEIQSDMNTSNVQDVTNPTVSITAPAAGNVSGTINVNANAADNIGVTGVQFFLDGANLGTEDITAPYTVSWNTTTIGNGPHTLTARARDAAGNTATSAGVAVTVNNDIQAPTVSITAPAAGPVNGTINVNASAADNTGVVGVQFLLDGANLGSEDLTAPYTVSWNTTTIGNGPHTLTARARDAAGNTTVSTGVAVTVDNDTQGPTVSITAPGAGVVSGVIDVNADAADNTGVVGVQFLLDGNNLGSEDVSAPYTVSWNSATISDGSHTLTARARDAAGNMTTSGGVIVNVQNAPPDTEAPAVNITAPAAGNVSGTVNVNAGASDNVGVVGVQFLLNGVNLGSEDITAPYSVSWNTTTAANGPYTLTARARDAAGNTTTSAEVAVTVDNDIQDPTVSITSPAAGTVNGTVNVNADAADNTGVVGVQFLLDGANLGSEDLSAPYSVSWNTTTVTEGNHTLTARARDAAGNITVSSGVIVTVQNVVPDTQFPAVSVTAPSGGTVAGTVSVTASASDNVGVVGVQFLLDGVNLGSEDLSAPYSVSWNTLTTANGPHNLSARARDAAGNVTTSAVIAVTVSNTNLVAAYGFNENTGTAANDNSGNNNHGTLTNGPTWSADGRFGAAIVFDGSNDYVNINDANSLDLTSGMTMEAWVNPTNLTGFKTIICKDRTTTNFTYTLAANNNTSNTANQRPSSRIRIGSANSTVTGTTKLALNTWTHVASTYDGANFRLYINGVQVSSIAVTGNITVTTNPLRIGGTTALSAQYFAGRIDEVRIYNRALTAAEIQSDMNTPIAPDVTNPTVNITAPAAGNVSGNINVTANATDNISVSGVQFLLDGANLGTEDLTAPYSVQWNTGTIANGNHTLTARARDAAGNTTTSAEIIVNVNNDTESPAVNLTAPSAGTVDGTIIVSADATDNVGVAGVQFLLNGANLGAEDVSAPFSISWNTNNVTDGSYTLTARARDAAGNTLVSTPVIVNVLNHPPDTDPPTVSITAPAAGEVAGTVNVNADAADNVGVAGVQFLLNGANLGTEDISSPYSVSWNTTTLANGSYTLTARARDAAGNPTTSLEVIVTVNNLPDTEAPSVSITAPAAGNVSGSINISANANDNTGVVGVQFLLDGVNFGSEDLTFPYSIPWNTATVTNGSHTLSAIARDAAGNNNTAAGIIVNVDNDLTPPTASITAPGAGTVSGTINVNANAGDNVGVVGVQFLLNGVALGSEDLTAPYSISWNTTSYANGNYTITARARDAAGNNVTSAGVVVTVSNITNLIAALNMNENTGTTANDISGNSHHGTLTGGPAWVAGKYGQAVNYDGSNDYINIADHNNFTLDPAQNYTWSAWVKNNTFTEWSTVWSQTINSSNFFYFYAHTSSDPDGGPVTNGVSVYWWLNNGSSKLGAHSSNNVLTAGQWSHITVTYNASQPQNNRFTIYVNGVDVTVRTDVASVGTLTAINPTSIRIGSNQPFGEYFNGAIDEVRFYRRLLTGAEVVTDMNTPVGLDNIPPTVSLTAPAAGNVSGTVNVTANAADNFSVVGVQFLLDGVALGTEDITAPYSVSWTTETATNGPHVLTARARDAAGNVTTSSEVTVNVTPDFLFTLLTPTRNVESTGTIDFRIYVTYQNGFTTQGINLSVDGLPTGTTGHFLFNPMSHQGETQLFVNTSNTPLGSYPITLTATSFNGITHTQQGTLNVTAAADFNLTAAPSISNVSIGNSTSFTINVNETNDYINPVTLSVLGVPTGVNVTFSPTAVTPAGTSTLTFGVTASATPGTYNLTVQGVNGATVRTVPITLTIFATPAVWTISTIGSTGTPNNTIRVGALKDDGLERVYVGTIGTGRMLEYSWSGSAWTGPIDVGGSPGGFEIHDCDIGDGRGDGKQRLYAAAYDFNIYEIWHDATGWHQLTVGGLNNNLGMHMATGDGRNDGVTRLYAASTQQLFEFTWNGTSWTRTLIGSTPGAHGVALGKGRNDGKNYIYIASISSGNFEVFWNGTSWVINSMGDNGDSRGIGLGDGRNDGTTRVYAAIYDGRMREFTWNGSAWTFANLPNTGIQNVHAYVVPGRNDGINRLYTDNGNGKVWEYSWNGTGWDTYNMGGGSDYMYGLHYGRGRNDGLIRLYSTDRGSVNRVYEFTWTAPNPIVFMRKENETSYTIRTKQDKLIR